MISDMARAGIPIYGYHWMPGLVRRIVCRLAKPAGPEVEIYPSDSNGIEFCQGTFSEMEDDVNERGG